MPFSLCSGFFRSFFLPGEFCLEGFDPLPAFFAAVTKRRALSREEIQEIQRMIDEAEG